MDFFLGLALVVPAVDFVTVLVVAFFVPPPPPPALELVPLDVAPDAVPMISMLLLFFYQFTINKLERMNSDRYELEVFG